MQRHTVYLYLETSVHVSGGTSTHHQERIQLYLQHLVFVTPLLLSAAIVEELELVWVCCGWRTPTTVFWFSVLPEKLLILRRNKRDMNINLYLSSCKVPLFVSDLNGTRIFSTDFRKILKYQLPWKSSSGRPVAPWERTYGPTYMTNLAVILPLICERDYHHNTRNYTSADHSCQKWYPMCLVLKEICIGGKAVLQCRHALL
jgi:hypothetical protein